jgi:hypothetical protein
LTGNGRWRRAWSGHGNGKVATVTPPGAHRPSRCRDDDCTRLLCRGYKDGYEDGYDDGYRDGYGQGSEAGYAAGAADASK